MKLIMLLFVMLLSYGGFSQQKLIIPIPQHQVFKLDKPKDMGTLTTNKAIYKGVEYPVYATRAGRLFIKTISPTTLKEGRKYIPQPLM